MCWGWQNGKQMEVPSLSSFSMWLGDSRLGETGAKDRTHSLKHAQGYQHELWKNSTWSTLLRDRVLLLYMLHFFSVLAPHVYCLNAHSPCQATKWQWTSYLSSNYDFLLLFIDSLFSAPGTLYHGKHYGVSKAWQKWSMLGSRWSSGRDCRSSRKPGFDL